MSVRFTSEVEKERMANLNRMDDRAWEYFKTTSLVKAARAAREMGWKENEVQVKGTQIAEDVVEYSVEPYEKDCGCPGLLKYSDFFD